MHTHGAGRRSEIEKPRGSRTAPCRAKGFCIWLRSSLSGLVTVHYLTSLDSTQPAELPR